MYRMLTENEFIYMNQPERYEIAGKEKEVCVLDRPIYSLKQALSYWNDEFNKFLVDFGFARYKSDTCVYVRITSDGEYTTFMIYVDDVASNQTQILRDILDYFRKHFQVRSMPPKRFFVPTS
jgi:hypothetical protein